MGYTEAGIGRKLNIKRQTVHKALNVANQKIRQALEETAKIDNIEIETVSPTQGYLTGYSPHFSTKAFVTYSPMNGVQIWYRPEATGFSPNLVQPQPTTSPKLRFEHIWVSVDGSTSYFRII